MGAHPRSPGTVRSKQVGHGINKNYFGDIGNTNILVQFYGEAGAVPGFIVRQKGSSRFICEDSQGNRKLCELVLKPSFALNPGEMCIEANWNGDVYFVSKIQQHLVTIGGGQVPWSFDSNLNPGTAQIQDYGQAPVLYLGTNSYITFGEGADDYDSLSYDNPPLPKIMVDADDNSLQYMYYGAVGSAPTRLYVVRYQGDSSTGTSPQNSDMIIEYHFPEAHKDRIQIHIIENGRNGGGYSAIASADTELATFDPTAGNAFEWDDTAQTLTPIALNEHGTSGLSFFDLDGSEGGGEPPYDDWSEDDGFVGFFVPWTVRFNGTDWSA